MFARLAPNQVAAVSDRQVPLDTVLRAGIHDAADIGVIATRAAKGRIAVLLWHYHDDDVSGSGATVHVVMAGGRTNGVARLWRVDARHANAFGAWQVMGSPARTDESQIAALHVAARLVAEDVPLRNGAIGVTIPRQGVVLLELER